MSRMPSPQGGWDAILLDVDNGPDGLSMPGNDRLYGVAGIGRARAALVPGGVLAVWSAAPDKPFANRLRGAGLARRRAPGPRAIERQGAAACDLDRYAGILIRHRSQFAVAFATKAAAGCWRRPGEGG